MAAPPRKSTGGLPAGDKPDALRYPRACAAVGGLWQRGEQAEHPELRAEGLQVWR